MSSSRLPLTPLDALEVHVLVDNEVDPISSYSQISPGIEVSGRFADLGMTSPFPAKDRGAAKKEMRMERLCCGAHGLSLMIVGHMYSTSKHFVFLVFLNSCPGG